MDKYIEPSERKGTSRQDMGKIANAIDRKSIDQLTVKVSGDDKIIEVASIIKRILTRRHFNVNDYQIIIPEEIMAQKQKTQRIFNIVMGAIAGISLLVGGIGIMNIMLANIMERTREIGIRRAVGATRQDVLNQFIFEALTISFVGGVLGIITGYILTSLISSYADWRTIITPFSVILAFFVSILVGFIFGSYPAKKAAEKDPIESLRYE
jgi:putative ABC transport system permease protein